MGFVLAILSHRNGKSANRLTLCQILHFGKQQLTQPSPASPRQHLKCTTIETLWCWSLHYWFMMSFLMIRSKKLHERGNLTVILLFFLVLLFCYKVNLEVSTNTFVLLSLCVAIQNRCVVNVLLIMIFTISIEFVTAFISNIIDVQKIQPIFKECLSCIMYYSIKRNLFQRLYTI